jgi:serine/threonine protein kinase
MPLLYSPGMEIYKYRLQNIIGRGEFGEVWTAQDAALDTTIAIKLLDKERISIDERLLEARIGASLNHPNVVNIKGADIIDFCNPPVSIVVITMPYYANGSVAGKVNSANFLDLAQAVKCLIDVLRGLEYLHENNYFHCDIKPQNILVGENGEYIVSDYGLTSYSPTHAAITPRLTYIPHAAPETISDSVYDIRTDIYQLGITAYRLLSGISLVKDEFAKSRERFEQKVLEGKLISKGGFQPFVPIKLRKIILKAVDANPDKRYQTALEMRRELEKINLKGATATADQHGQTIVRKAGYSYYYRLEHKARGASVFQAYKENEGTHKVTKVSAYTCRPVNTSEIRKAEENFFLSLMK